MIFQLQYLNLFWTVSRYGVTVKNDNDLIKRYREVVQHPECDMAIEDIINEVIVSDDRDQSVSISLDKLSVSENIKTKIRNEFDEV